jgi:hypothetical protein
MLTQKLNEAETQREKFMHWGGLFVYTASRKEFRSGLKLKSPALRARLCDPVRIQT